jgi:RND family efflux transporter MFP subunit
MTLLRPVTLTTLTTLVLLGACGGKPPAPAAPPPKPVDVLTLAPIPTRDTGEYLGSLLSRGSVNVLPQVGGYVKNIHVKPGQRVKAGDVLVDIDAREQIAAKDAAVAARASAESRLALAQQSATRTQALTSEGIAPAQELERANAEVQAAQAAVAAAAAAVEQRSVSLNFHGVRAAVAGTVGEVSVRIGDAVTPATLLTTIAQADVLELSIGLPAARARTLPPDAPVEVLDAAGNVIVTSTVFYAAPQADPATQLVVVKSVFDNTAKLRPSEVVRARIVFGTSDALQVPALSVVRTSGQPFLYVLGEKDGATVVKKTPVKLGRMVGQAYVVESGVDAGARVAISGLQSLRDGAPVVPKAPGAPPTPGAPPAGPAGPASPASPPAADAKGK